MSRSRLFCPEFGVGSVALSTEEAHHALAVRRMKVGDHVCLFDGAGREGVGTVADARRHALRVEVQSVSRRPFELSRKITLAVAMPKGPRAGYLVEKCTELGVAAIWPILAERSVAIPRPDAAHRWSRRAIEAAKQSQRAWVPAIAPPQKLAEVLARGGSFECVALTDTHAHAQTFMQLLTLQPPLNDMLVLIGPEGGWSEAERSQARGANAVGVALGPMTLRTETAAAAVCAVASLLETSRGRTPAP